MTTIGIIGGTGVYEFDGIANLREVELETPFGPPSDAFVIGKLGGASLVFVPRHGHGHRHLPSEVPYRANIFALKSLGVEWLISVSAVGSLREEIQPGDIALPAQFVDRTRRGNHTFFGRGVVAHAAAADPVCRSLTTALAEAAQECDLRCHSAVTYVCIEGPTFSTRAESMLYRQWGMDIIGMTAMPEARLAREAELHYATVALVTDYDCWRTPASDVDVTDILAVLKRNRVNVQRMLSAALPKVLARAATTKEQPACPCATALEQAVLTDRARIPDTQREQLAPLLAKYL